MILENLHLMFFKNYDEANINFSPHINCFIGDNGSGKTNLLDAIHYLSLTKSAFSASDQQNIKQEETFFVVKGQFKENEEKQVVQCNLQAGQKKVVMRNKVPYDKVSDHIGRFPVVMSTPYDTDLIREGSEERRKFFDGFISQLNHEYLDKLLLYNRLLKQRNSLLKQFAEKNYFDKDYLNVLDEQLEEPALYLAGQRRAVLAVFEPIFQNYYQNLTESREKVKLEYKSKLSEGNFPLLLKDAQRKDLALQRTTVGPHKDDYIFLMNDFPVKQFGSQGQQKSYVIALKLAQFDLLSSHLHQKPLLLLDDIFDRLDQNRMAQLMQMVADHRFGQIFLTDTDLGRTRQTLSGLSDEISYFKVHQGEVKLITPA